MENQESKAWSELNLSAEMLQLIEMASYRNPTLVQSMTIPLVMEGHDVLVSSQTGSGKTASFVIPTVEKFKGKNGTYILALAPTREIAQQTGAVFEQFAGAYGMKVAVCIGGASIPVEKEALAASPHIIVATPGRLCDHLERGNVWLDFIQCLIFDEADRMLEMGFAKQIDIITEQIPKERQTLMFSATYTPIVEKLARKAMKEPKEVTIKKTADTAPKIEQTLFWVPEEKKLQNLLKILRQDPGTMFVFVNAKERAYQVWRSLANAGFESATYIHSDLPQEAREQAVADFKAGKFRVIIATDVMGRGIDVDDVAHVVNYDVPREPADYIHRIGRTGRRGLSGHASTFAIPGKDDRSIKEIAKLRGVTAPEREETPKRDERAPRDAGRRDGRRDQRGPRRDERPRDDRPRDDRPRDHKPREHKPREQKPRDSSQREQHKPVHAPAAAPVVEAKPKGLIARIKSFFSGK
jgi:ATP-dependent RNA helicase RhlE